MLRLGLNSVVAVHGLYGDRETTWTYEEEREEGEIEDKSEMRWNWLKDGSLTEPEPRTLTFGYDASLTNNGIVRAEGIKEKALKLLDELVEHRMSIPPVRLCL